MVRTGVPNGVGDNVLSSDVISTGGSLRIKKAAAAITTSTRATVSAFPLMSLLVAAVAAGQIDVYIISLVVPSQISLLVGNESHNHNHRHH